MTATGPELESDSSALSWLRNAPSEAAEQPRSGETGASLRAGPVPAHVMTYGYRGGRAQRWTLTGWLARCSCGWQADGTIIAVYQAIGHHMITTGQIKETPTS